MEKVIFEHLGRIGYQEAWDYQTSLHQDLIRRKRANRGLSTEDPSYEPRVHHLLLCEHPPVYTLGKSGSLDNLLLDEEGLQREGVEFFKINRGGDITYHGPGQVVGYPIFDLDGFFTDVHKYVRTLEEVIIQTIGDYGLKGIRVPEFTGVWLEADEVLPKRKICAIGVHLSRWVSMHGFAFNVNTELQYFRNIVPCGIDDKDKDVTSLSVELGREVDLDEVRAKVLHYFSELFEFEIITKNS